MSSYHDVYVTTSKMKRTRISDLPFGYELTCNRVGGWTLWGPSSQALKGRIGPFPAPVKTDPIQLGSEFGPGLRVEVGDVVVVDSLTAKVES